MDPGFFIGTAQKNPRRTMPAGIFIWCRIVGPSDPPALVRNASYVVSIDRSLV